MNTSLRFAVALPAILLFLCGSALADPVGPPKDDKPASSPSAFFIAPQIGTLGIGLNIGYQVNEIFKTRFNMNYLGYARSESLNGVKVDANYTSATFGLLADVHPFSGRFRMTGGLYYASMVLDATANPQRGQSYKIGDKTYRGEELGSGQGSAKWQRLAPYLGIGFGPGAGGDSGFSFSADIGALMIGAPDVSMGFSGPRVSRGDISKYESEAKNSIRSNLPFWPVLSLGFAYRF